MLLLSRKAKELSSPTKRPNNQTPPKAKLTKSTQEIGTQTDHTGPLELGGTLRDLRKGDTYEEFEQMRDLNCEDNVYKNTSIEETGSPLEAGNDRVKVIWVDPNDPSLTKGIQRLYKERYPILANILNDFEIIEQITRTSSGETNTQKVIRAVQGPDERALWDNLVKIKGHWKQEKA